MVLTTRLVKDELLGEASYLATLGLGFLGLGYGMFLAKQDSIAMPVLVIVGVLLYAISFYFYIRHQGWV